MTAQANPYVKVYYSIIDDPKFASIYDDDAALSAWLRLLLVADGTYPAPAPLPLATKKRTLSKLIDAGLIDLCPGSRYRIHGLETEREKRSSAARAGGLARAERTHSGSTAPAQREHSAVSASPLHSAPLHSAPLQRAREADPIETYHLLTGRPPKKATISWLDELANDHGAEAVCRTMVTVWTGKADLGSFIGDVQAALVLKERRSSQEAEERRRKAAADHERQERERIANASPEEKARAAEISAGIKAFVGGLPR
jgi:hypothetical protein